MDENVVDVDEKDSEELLKDKDSFTYKLRRQLNSWGELRYENMSSSSVEKYEKIVKKFVKKLKWLFRERIT